MGLEEITPRPVDSLYLGVQVTHIDDKEYSSKDHLNQQSRQVRITRHNSILANRRIPFRVLQKLVLAAQQLGAQGVLRICCGRGWGP